MTYIKATLRGRSFAIPAGELAAVLDGTVPAPVPFAPPEIRGLLRYEEAMIAVYDTFGQPLPPARLSLVLRQGQRVIACTADTVEGTVTLDEKEAAALKIESLAIKSGLLML